MALEGEELMYGGQIDLTPAKTPDADTDNFSTLEDVYKKFKAEIKDLEHVNAFDTMKTEDEEKASKILLRQIDAKQEAFRILEPLYLQLESAVKDVIKARKGEE